MSSCEDAYAFRCACQIFYCRADVLAVTAESRITEAGCSLAEALRTQRFFILCRSGFSREFLMFATEVAPTNAGKSHCVLSASAVNI